MLPPLACGALEHPFRAPQVRGLRAGEPCRFRPGAGLWPWRGLNFGVTIAKNRLEARSGYTTVLRQVPHCLA